MTTYETDRAYAVRAMPSAAQAIRDIHRYLAEGVGDPDAAARSVDRVLSGVDSLERLPRRRRVVATDPLTGLELRSLPSGNYTILYVVAASEVCVLTVLASCADIESRIAEIFEYLAATD